ncbi:MAG: outer membrane lipoprotein chaperone LolA, partial [Arenimonas sp.]
MRRLCFAALVLLVSAANAQDARRQYLQFATGLNSAAAEFRQTVTGPNGEKVQSAQGNMEMRAPDRFRWEYRAPAPQLIVADGRKVWIYDPELRQVTVKPQDAMNQDNPLSALLRPETVERFYRVSELPARQGLQWLQL